MVVVLLLAVIVANGQDADEPAAPATTLPAGVETIPADNTTSAPGQPDPTTSPSPDGTVVEESCAVPALITRGCSVRMRQGVNATAKLPVVVLLHGLNSNEVDVRNVGQWDEALLEHDFILVTPSGLAGSWNAGICCGIANATNVDDVAYLNELIDRISARPDVDPERISMVGFSNGGLMTYRYLCAGGSRLNAAVSVAGTRTVDCFSNEPIPVLQVHGTADETVPYNGGQGIVAVILGVTFAPVESTVADIAAAQQCGPEAITSEDATITRRQWSGCANASHVDLWTLHGWGHDWMRSPIDTTTEIIRYVGIA